jgi:enamine deaminase RidA (YjgF/YER057c/UK114 family)
MDKSFHGPIMRLDQLDEAAHMLGANRVDDTEPILAQSWHIFREIEKMLNSVGSDLSKVVQQTVLLRDASDYAVVEQVARIWCKGVLPPTTVIACDDIGPYPGLLLEIESIAVR